MQIWQKSGPGSEFFLAAAAWAACCALLAGCASPQPPLPPTLNLPGPVKDLRAVRIGGEVRLKWTTPGKTTDKLPVKGAMTAEVCREADLPPKGGMIQPGVSSGGLLSGAGLSPRCSVVARMTVTPGESEAVDTLGVQLAQGARQLLAYRVQLLNAAGRTAGLSAVAYAAAGAGPDAVEGFAGETSSAGVVLRWQAAVGPGTASSGMTVELDRTLLDPAARVGIERKNGLPGTTKPATEMRLSAGNVGGNPGDDGVMAGRAVGTSGRVVGTGGGTNGRIDRPDETSARANGIVDRTVEVGHSYRYTAQRVQTVTVAGQTLRMESVASPELTFAVRDVFPPSAPVGLVTVPGYMAGIGRQRPTIDLSWEPVLDQNVKPRLAGYRVYRRAAAGAATGAAGAGVAGAASGTASWTLLPPRLVTETAYRDSGVAPGQRYAYRVTAVSTAGNESAPSAEAQETTPAE